MVSRRKTELLRREATPAASRRTPASTPHRTSLQTLEYHSPLEGESQKPEPNGEGFCGGGFAQGEPRARSCAPPRSGTSQPTGEGRCGGGRSCRRLLPAAESHLRGAALAPLRIDCGRCTLATPRWPPSGSKTGFALSPTPPLGGSDYSCSVRGFSYPPQIIPPSIPPERPFKHSSITPPLRGSRRSPSRMAKASAEGGSRKASQGRDLVRRRGQARANLQAKAGADGGDRAGASCPLPSLTYGAPRWPPSGSKTGFALSPTPPQGGSDT